MPCGRAAKPGGAVGGECCPAPSDHRAATRSKATALTAADRFLWVCLSRLWAGFRLRGQLIKVIVVPCLSSERMSVAFKQLPFAVNGDYLLDEGSPKVGQAHRKRFLILCTH